MKHGKITAFAVAAIGLLGSVAIAQSPFVNIDRNRHGNLAAAQQYIVQAYGRVSDAQHANHDRLGGHAQRAKELLTEANEELRLAADTANANENW